MASTTLLPRRGEGPPDSPYKLAGGHKLSLPLLMPTLQQLQSRGDDGSVLHVWFIYASGRFHESTGQIGLVCDALWVPEITLTLATQIGNRKLAVRSMLDIDLEQALEDGHTDLESRPHLVVCGTGDINITCARIIHHYQNLDQMLRPGLAGPYSADLLGCRDTTRYSAPTLQNAGLLTAVRSPWWDDRIAVICGGIFGSGTVGTLWMLNQYLNNDPDGFGDNRYDDEVPGKIIDATPRQYTLDHLRKLSDLIPQHDITNIEDGGVPISVVE